MYFQLVIADALEQKPKEPDGCTGVIAPDQCVVRSKNDSKETGRVSDQAEKSLQHENINECTNIIASLSVNAPPGAHVNVAVVLLRMAHTDVVRQTSAPDRHERCDKDRASEDSIASDSIVDEERCDGRDEGQAPEHIDVGVVLLALAVEECKNIPTDYDDTRQPEVDCLHLSCRLTKH